MILKCYCCTQWFNEQFDLLILNSTLKIIKKYENPHLHWFNCKKTSDKIQSKLSINKETIKRPYNYSVNQRNHADTLLFNSVSHGSESKWTQECVFSDTFSLFSYLSLKEINCRMACSFVCETEMIHLWSRTRRGLV